MMIIGIDLGTTNSLVSVWKDGQSHIIPNALGDDMTPSIVEVGDNGQILFGIAALDRLITHSNLSVSTFKRYMGTAVNFNWVNFHFVMKSFLSFFLSHLNLMQKPSSLKLLTK